MRESRGKSPNRERVESKARSDAERIVRLNSALRSVAEIVDAALRDDHRSEYLAQQVVENLAQGKVESRTGRKTGMPQASARSGESRSDAGGLGPKVIVPPYGASAMS